MRWSHLTAIAFSVSFIAMGDASKNSASVSFRTKSQISSCLTSLSSSSSSYRWNSNQDSVAIFSSCRSILQNIPRGGEALTENTIETSEEEGVSSDLNSETEASTNTDKRITKKAAKKVKTKKTKIKDSKSTTQETVNTVLEGKKVIQDALNEKDAAQALGDAIRKRADDWFESDPWFHDVNTAVNSIGWAMGQSEDPLHPRHRASIRTPSNFLPTDEVDDGGSVEVSPSAVLAHYFLHSHGGAHAIQSACSLLAVFWSTIAVVTIPKQMTTSTQWLRTSILLRRALLCATMKHLTGLLATTGVTARAIPHVGFAQARRWMEQLARDPISQYVLYTALIMVWLHTTTTITTNTQASVTTLPWFWTVPKIGRILPYFLLGPVCLREVISLTWVISDVLLLLHQTSSSSKSNTISTFLFRSAHALTDALLSLLVTPAVWRSSTLVQRQVILAKLTAKLSLAMEVVTGLILFVDTIVALSFLGGLNRIKSVLLKLLCARLYWNFLWVRRSKIQNLAQQIRGGAAYVPIRILDALYDPCSAMGISKPNMPSQSNERWAWKDYLLFVLGLTE